MYLPVGQIKLIAGRVKNTLPRSVVHKTYQRAPTILTVCDTCPRGQLVTDVIYINYV